MIFFVDLLILADVSGDRPSAHDHVLSVQLGNLGFSEKCISLRKNARTGLQIPEASASTNAVELCITSRKLLTEPRS